jgi:excisionase family DNA binding protein
MTERKFLDLPMVSDYTLLSKSTIYKKVCSREIPFHKIGKKTIFVREEIDDWMINNGRMLDDLPEIKII